MNKAYSSNDYKAELDRLKQKTTFKKIVMSSIYTLITVAAVAVLVAVLLLPVLRIYGTSMTPTLEEGEYVVSVKGDRFSTGDV
ncbi:MAG: S24 family peptidase, partial [Erysipelotrichaceae bacterium]|nr:S24 family peptidase [Erysipelotrichaceae bacterium]